MKLYKLTDENGQTRNATQWGPGVTHETDGSGGLCSSGWLHAYEHPLLAVFLNPIHANFANPRMFEAEGDGEVKWDGQLKIGVTKLTTIRELPLPMVTTEQRAKFAILCGKVVCKDVSWNAWADKWLSGEDRSLESAAQAAWVATGAEAAAATAAWADGAAGAAEWAAEWAARTAARAEWAARTEPDMNLSEIAEEACK